MVDNPTARNRFLIVQALVAAAAMAGLRPAAADLTVEDLTGHAITGVGPYYQDVEDAIRRFAKKDYGGALERLEHAKQKVPRLAPPEVMMAQLYLDGGQAGSAIAMLERAITHSPQDPEAYVMLAERGVSEGRVSEASMMFDKASHVLDAFADNPRRKADLQKRIYNGGANADEARGDSKAARAKLEALIKLDPQDAATHERLGRVLFALGDQRGAYGELKAAAEADKNMPSPELAMSSLFAGDKVNAEKWLKAALAKGGNDLRTQLAATRAFIKSNQLGEARTHADAAIKLDPQGAEANLLLGLVARATGDFKTAETHLSKAHLLSPANPLIVNQLALTLLEVPGEENQQRALQFAEVNSRQNPNVPELLATLGWINYRLNHRAEAERAFNVVLGANAQSGNRMLNADMLYYMANLVKDRGRTDEAVKMLKEALNVDEAFAYRKPAQALLDELTKSEKSTGAKTEAAPAAAKGRESAKAATGK